MKVFYISGIVLLIMALLIWIIASPSKEINEDSAIYMHPSNFDKAPVEMIVQDKNEEESKENVLSYYAEINSDEEKE